MTYFFIFKFLAKELGTCCLSAGVPLKSPSSMGRVTQVTLPYIAERYPRAPLLGLGFSLGANLPARYVAEGESCRFSVCACLHTQSTPDPFCLCRQHRRSALGCSEDPPPKRAFPVVPCIFASIG